MIDLGHCLQLANRDCLEYLREAYQNLKEFCAQQGVPLPQNTGRFFGNRKLDCAVFEAVHRLRANRSLPPFDTVAAYFVEGEELYPGAAVRALDHAPLRADSGANPRLLPAARDLSGSGLVASLLGSVSRRRPA